MKTLKLKLNAKVEVISPVVRIPRPHSNLSDATYTNKPLSQTYRDFIPKTVRSNWVLLPDGLFPVTDLTLYLETVGLRMWETTPTKHNIETQEYEEVTEKHPLEGETGVIKGADPALKLVLVKMDSTEMLVWFALRFLAGK